MPMGFRPQGGDGPMYSPQRDLAYITPTIMQGAMARLDEQNWTANQREYFESVGLTAQALGQAVEALAESQRFFVEASDTLDYLEALRHGGFTLCAPVAQDVVLAAVGQALVAAWFHGVREVTRLGDVPFSAEGTSMYMAYAKWVAERLGVRPLEPHAQLLADKEELNIVAIHNGLRISLQAQELGRRRNEIARCRSERTEAAQTAEQLRLELAQAIEQLTRLRSKLEVAEIELIQRRSEGLWARIRRWWRDTSNPVNGF